MRDLGKYASAYEIDRFESVMVKMRRRVVLELIQRVRPASILEIGCGLEPLFTAYCGSMQHVVVEPCESFAEHARQLAKGNPKVKVICSRFEEETEISGGSHFDLIVISSLIHELPNAAALVGRARQFCNERSLVHVNVPNSESFHIRLAEAMGLLKDRSELSDLAKRYQRHRTYNLAELRCSMNEWGFAVEDSGDYFLKPFTHGQMSSMLEAGIIGPQVLDGLMNVVRCFPGAGAEIFVNCRLA